MGAAARAAAPTAGAAAAGVVPLELAGLMRPHIDSYNYFLDQGLAEVLERLEPVHMAHGGHRLRVWLENARVEPPRKGPEDGGEGCTEGRLFPRQCREQGSSYRGTLLADVCRSVDDGGVERLPRKLALVPVMVKSAICHLRHLSPAELRVAGEEEHEIGGYFICNGNEKIIRLLIANRRNYALALRRSAFTKRGPEYTDMACLMRCVRPDQSSVTVRVHYLTNGKVNVSFSIRRQEFFIPAAIVLKALVESSDREIYERLVAGAIGGPASAEGVFVSERAELLVQEAAAWGLRTRAQAVAYLGAHLRPVVDSVQPEDSDAAAGEKLLRDVVFVHLDRPVDKYALLIVMLHKLYALASGACAEDNADSLLHQEALLPGHLLTIFLKERLQDWLLKLKQLVDRDARAGDGSGVDLADAAYFRRLLDKNPAEIGRAFDYMLATGNLNSRSGLDLSQQSGFTLVAEKLNVLRYLSHFRSVHRGAYFAQVRTTTVRKLLPDSWGFLCPVHTPDGSPCGLLSHLTAVCDVVIDCVDGDVVRALLATLLAPFGLLPAQPGFLPPGYPQNLPVLLDGRVLGFLGAASMRPAVSHLRAHKAHEPDGPLATVELAFIPHTRGGPFPGLYAFSTPARFMRPVTQLATGHIELIGSLEQAYLDIAVEDGGDCGGAGMRFTHRELDPSAILSVVASLTPWSDYNQSPRNMYQCQMAKQTMGVPLHSLPHRPDNKLFWLQNGQVPIARTRAYEAYSMASYPTGTNAVVAVLSYTGYDMEDAMIINKSAMERGFKHASLYKAEWIDLTQSRSSSGPGSFIGRGPHDFDAEGRYLHEKFIGPDGLPHIGLMVQPGEPYCSEVDSVTGRSKLHRLKGQDPVVVEQVSVMGAGGNAALPGPQKAVLKLRYNRNPIIGDKFASRAGQKGTLSVLWPDVDMPFCDRTGMRPDLIINPHAFPSRMTIGMLVESMAGKVGALQGQFQDATPFQRQENGQGAGDVYSKALEAAGFNYHGSEAMTSGVTGCEFTADIYIGLVYYQRLRHMVSDKFQVRSTGPINNLTRQPVKGRKLGGGIRFGEMERDSLLAHGAAYLLHDRLHTCSDLHVADVCTSCGSLVSTSATARPAMAAAVGPGAVGLGAAAPARVECRVCGHGRCIARVALPYVFRYLICELASMNIRVSMTVV